MKTLNTKKSMLFPTLRALELNTKHDLDKILNIFFHRKWHNNKPHNENLALPLIDLENLGNFHNFSV